MTAGELRERLADADPQLEVYFRAVESGDDLVVDVDTSDGKHAFLLGSES